MHPDPKTFHLALKHLHHKPEQLRIVHVIDLLLVFVGVFCQSEVCWCTPGPLFHRPSDPQIESIGVITPLSEKSPPSSDKQTCSGADFTKTHSNVRASICVCERLSAFKNLAEFISLNPSRTTGGLNRVRKCVVSGREWQKCCCVIARVLPVTNPSALLIP